MADARQAADHRQRQDFAERRVVIGDKLLSWENFERYVKATDVVAQEILDAAPLTPEGALKAAKEQAVIGARDIAGVYAARQALGPLTEADRMFGVAQQSGPHSAMLGVGPVVGAFTSGGIAQMLRAPGKMFSRETVCAIIRGQIAITHDSHLKDLLHIFENLE